MYICVLWACGLKMETFFLFSCSVLEYMNNLLHRSLNHPVCTLTDGIYQDFSRKLRIGCHLIIPLTLASGFILYLE